MSNFQIDPYRTGDPALNRLKQIVAPNSAVIDVGGGAGRYALPLSYQCKQITVVEPADSMVDALNETMRAESIQNVTAMQMPWEEADLEAVDVVLSAHSVYGVPHIEPFIRKLEAKATGIVVLFVYVDQPGSVHSSLWKPVYGEERVDLPALRNFMNVLWEMDIYASLEMLEAVPPVPFTSREVALEQIGHSLFIAPGSIEERKLNDAIDDFLVQSGDGVLLKYAKPRRLGIITWVGHA